METNALENAAPKIVDFRALYPLTLRYIVRDNIWWSIGLIVVLGLIFVPEMHKDAWQESEEQLVNLTLLLQKKLTIALGLSLVLLARLTYAVFYRMTYVYKLEGSRLRIVRGIFLREEACLPLLPLTEIYVRGNLWDQLFALRNVYVALPAERVAQIAELRGLSVENAHKLRDHLSAVISRMPMQPISEHARAAISNVRVT